MSDAALRFQRSRLLYGEAGFAAIQSAHFVVIGTGAVGSYCVESCARAGVQRMSLVDMDVIELSNCNRQLYALTSTLGEEKVAVAAARVRDINPAAEVDTHALRITADNVDTFLGPRAAAAAAAGHPFVVCDCIDSLDDKVALVAYCVAKKIAIVSSFGAARRPSPLGVGRAPFMKTTGDQLGRLMRKRLPKQLEAFVDTEEEIKAGLKRAGTRAEPDRATPMVYAVFSPVKAMDLPQECKESETRLLPSGPTTTGIFGLWVGDTALAWTVGMKLE